MIIIIILFLQTRFHGCQAKVHLPYYFSKAHLAYANQVIACANASLGAQLPHLKHKFRAEWKQPLHVQFPECTHHDTQYGEISP